MAADNRSIPVPGGFLVDIETSVSHHDISDSSSQRTSENRSSTRSVRIRCQAPVLMGQYRRIGSAAPEILHLGIVFRGKRRVLSCHEPPAYELGAQHEGRGDAKYQPSAEESALLQEYPEYDKQREGNQYVAR
jgi:hypothetical protein